MVMISWISLQGDGKQGWKLEKIDGTEARRKAKKMAADSKIDSATVASTKAYAEARSAPYLDKKEVR